FLISCGDVLYEQLESNYDWSKHFQAVIDLDYMNVEEIRQAIVIRHGATHKALVNEQGLPLSPKSFQQLVNRVYRASNGNIGEALNRWAFLMEPAAEDQVKAQQERQYNLPDFLQPDIALLLRTMMIEKRTNEYRLRQRFGPAFNPGYAQALLRLLSVGLVQRHLDGWLEINEAVVNDIYRLLKTNQYLA
ncbi:MAG: hypothetical protein AAF840_18230, partial [Bacteroidota bacterium]